MRLSKGLLLGGLVALAASVWLWAYGCDERLTRSWPPPEPPKDYPVYFRDGVNHQWCFVYYPVANRVDSLRLPVEANWGFSISPDGDLLYAFTEDRTHIVSLDSLTVVGELRYPQYPRRGVIPSPDGQLLAMRGEIGFDIIRTSDHSLVFSDTDEGFGRCTFSHDSRYFYGCVTIGSGAAYIAYIYRVDLQDTTNVLRRELPDFIDRVPIDIEPSHDDRLWLLLERSGSFDYWFEVYDPEADSVIFREYMTPGWGEIDISPDGRYAFYTNPGDLIGWPIPPPTITCYDILNNRIHKVISTENLISMPISSIAITPDGRWLVGNNHLGYKFLVTMDMRKMEFVKYDSLSGLRFLHSLVIQQNP
jgi:hypothetical protein